MLRLIIIRGYPGSGKTTIGRLLEKNGHGVFINHNSILTFLAGIVGDDQGIYDDIYNLELVMSHKLLTEGKSVIMARVFSRTSSLRPYLDVAKAAGAKCIILRLDADASILKKRVAAPERRNDFNQIMDAEALMSYIESFPQEKVNNEFTVDASQDISRVLSFIERAIK